MARSSENAKIPLSGSFGKVLRVAGEELALLQQAVAADKKGEPFAFDPQRLYQCMTELTDRGNVPQVQFFRLDSGDWVNPSFIHKVRTSLIDAGEAACSKYLQQHGHPLSCEVKRVHAIAFQLPTQTLQYVYAPGDSVPPFINDFFKMESNCTTAQNAPDVVLVGSGDPELVETLKRAHEDSSPTASPIKKRKVSEDPLFPLPENESSQQ